MAAIVFMDTETTGLNVDDTDEIWEFAAIRRDEDGTESEWHTFVDHDEGAALHLPKPFLNDYLNRYNDQTSRGAEQFRAWSARLFAGQPHIVGAVPDFDTAALRGLLGVTRTGSQWHYHLWDAETLALGWLRGRASLGNAAAIAALSLDLDDSSELSRAIGVHPDLFDKHTAMGDARWVKAIYDAVTVTG